MSGKRHTQAHRIDGVGFVLARTLGVPSTEAPLDCECGWQGTAGTYQAHRTSQGAYNKHGNPTRPGAPFRLHVRPA